MSGLMPIARRVYVCDDVVRHPESGKPMIVNLWDTVRVPAGLPHTLAKLCLFAWLREVTADVSVRIEILFAGTSEQAFAPLEHVIHGTDPQRSVWAKFAIRDLRFEELGEYMIDVYANGELLDYQVINVVGG